MENEERIPYATLKALCEMILRKEGFSETQAENIVDVLIEADLRNIPSHGVARLKRYIDEKNAGNILVETRPEIVYETPVSAVIDGKGGPGQCVSLYAMQRVLEKAGKAYIGFVSVRNSNHYGITAYYSEMALKYGMIGIAMTNSFPLVVPTYGKEAVIGTNPFSIAIPGREHPFLLDMSTSVVTRGKLEVYERLGKEMNPGWAVDESGSETLSPGIVLDNFVQRKSGGILPLGGKGEESGGHKGYGLALMVELLTAGLSIGDWSAKTYQNGKAGVCHFFGAMDLKLFGQPDHLTDSIQSIVDAVVNGKKADGKTKIYYHGEKESEAREKGMINGINLDAKTRSNLRGLSAKLGIPIPEGL